MVSEKKPFENVDGRTDGQVTNGHYILTHIKFFGSGELKQQIYTNTHKYDGWNDENYIPYILRMPGV